MSRDVICHVMSSGTVSENLATEKKSLECGAQGIRELRFWSSADHAVVLGLGGRVEEDVDQKECQKHGVSILRRQSGGGTVLQGPGVLNVTLTQPWKRGLGAVRGELCLLGKALAKGVSAVGSSAWVEEDSGDVIIKEKGEPVKICGLSARAKSGGILLHGSVLVDPDMALMGSVLRVPKRQPAYRHGRSHLDFLGAVRSLVHLEKRQAFFAAIAECLNFQVPIYGGSK